LFVVCCLLFVVCCLLFVVCCLLLLLVFVLMLLFRFLFVFLAIAVLRCDSRPGDVEVIVSDEAGQRLSVQPQQLSWEKKTAPSSQVLSIDINQQFQTIHGFGGSFLRSGALTLNQLPLEKQDEVLKKLFDPEEGAGFTVGKVPIGACDYCPLTASPNETRWWSYRKNPLEPFSLGPDLEEPGGTVPYVMRAVQYIQQSKTPLWLQSTIDYPPRWMLEGDLPGATVNPLFYGPLAQYYLDFVQHFEDASGVPIHYLSLFNEPIDSYTNITTAAIGDLLVNHVFPTLSEAGS